MNRAQKKKIIFKACELIEKGRETYSCEALMVAENDTSIVKDYICFYGGHYLFDYKWDWDIDFKSRQRIMALLFFAEAGM